MTSQPETTPVPVVKVWTADLPVAEAAFLAGPNSPLNGSGCAGSISCNDEGRIWIDDPARAWLSQLDPHRDGACRWTGDDAAEIQCGGAWYPLKPGDRIARPDS